jgi:hypothetical protein
VCRLWSQSFAFSQGLFQRPHRPRILHFGLRLLLAAIAVADSATSVLSVVVYELCNRNQRLKRLSIIFFKGRYVLHRFHVVLRNGIQVKVYDQHDDTRQKEGHDGRRDGVDGAEVQLALRPLVDDDNIHLKKGSIITKVSI